MTEPQKKIVVFVAVPLTGHGDRYEFWCNERPRDLGGEKVWGCMLSSCDLDTAHATYLPDSCRFRAGTAFRVAVLRASGTFWLVDKFLGSDTLAAVDECGSVLSDLWSQAPIPFGCPPLAADMSGDAFVLAEQKKEEPELIKCSFCALASVALDRVFGAVDGGDEGLRSLARGLRCCQAHAEALGRHAERLRLGLVDCSETRQESSRFAARQDAERAAARAAISGYCTRNDLGKGSRPTVTERAKREPPEAIPLAGMTPHYEWP